MLGLALCVALGSGACSVLGSLDDLQGGSPSDGGTDGPLTDAPLADQASEDAGSDACGANLASDPENCGACGNACAAYELCVSGSCEPCDSAEHDCDDDGWLVSEGDCCDLPGSCGSEPEAINPGAIEISGNQIDDNCNLFDEEDTAPCDGALLSSSDLAEDYARALGICRTTTATPAKPEATWGLIEAELLRADGSPLVDVRAKSIRPAFGSVSPAAHEGNSIAVLSTGIAADGVQTNPGPNLGAPASSYMSTFHEPLPSEVDLLATCAGPACIADWFASENLPLKAANELPTAPDCQPTLAPNLAYDSVMLRLSLRAPTNMKSFRFRMYFLSAEYPEYVCSSYNDQLVALIDTPDGTPEIPNPSDKNLATYVDSELQKWPVGINVAKGTNLFSVCESNAVNPTCWDDDVASASCSLGADQLLGTGFEKPMGQSCTLGGGTGWLTMSGNVVPGELVELRIVIWDVNDTAFDSMVLLDGFAWQPDSVTPGTSSTVP
jgi:hypothetical protein